MKGKLLILMILLSSACAPTLKLRCMDKMGPEALIWSHTVAEARVTDEAESVVFWRCDGKKWVKDGEVR